jgi:glycosyltransferase involved in cell wall biosynthesis
MSKVEPTPTIYFYSDCSFFAGCENMIANFFNNQDFQEKYNVRLVYRNSPEYKIGLEKRIHLNINKTIPVTLLNQISFQYNYKIARLGLKLIYIPYKYFTILINAVILSCIFRKEKIDILHINNGGYPAAISCYAAVIAAKICGIKRIVYVVNNLAQPYNNIARFFDKPFDKMVVKNVNKFITSSTAAGKELISLLKIPHSNYATINNGISKREITQNKNDFKASNHIPADKIIFTTIANFERRKGHHYLLEAINKLKNSNDAFFLNRIHFLLEGNGPEKNSVIEYIKYYNLSEHVQIIENVKDIYNLYNVTDVLVVPSIGNEDFPNVVLEAMSLGKPVIGTNIAGIPEQIDNMYTGIIIPPKNANELLNAILKICTESDYLKLFSINALNKFANQYKIGIAIQKYDKLYQNLLINI